MKVMEMSASKVVGSLENIFVGGVRFFIDTYPEYAARILKTHESLADYSYILYIKPQSIDRENFKITINIADFFVASIIKQEINGDTDSLEKEKEIESLAKEKILVIVGQRVSVIIHDIVSDYDSLEGDSIKYGSSRIGYWIDESATCTVFYSRRSEENGLEQKNLVQNSTKQKSAISKNREKDRKEEDSIKLDCRELIKINCYAGRHSSLNFYFLVQGGLVPNSEINCYLLGEYADIKVDGAYLLQNKQQATVSVYQEHLVPHTSSNVMIKGVIKDSAYICYKGLIYIGVNAFNTDAEQKNKNILVGNNIGNSIDNAIDSAGAWDNVSARAHSIPSLEILNNDVRCSHGSAVGPIDKEQLFVLQSRGLDRLVATQVLIDGFIGLYF